MIGMLRREKGLSQKELGDLLDLSQSDISKIEKCERRIDLLETIEWIKATKGEDLIHVLEDICKKIDGNSH